MNHLKLDMSITHIYTINVTPDFIRDLLRIVGSTDMIYAWGQAELDIEKYYLSQLGNLFRDFPPINYKQPPANLLKGYPSPLPESGLWATGLKGEAILVRL